jgi:GNAT superfamily N-acetyltransferase
MIAIEPITAQNVWVFKAVRLRALEDAPHAFASTYAKESQLTDSDWMKRVERWNGETAAGFLAIDEDDDTACGIAGSFLDQNDPSRGSPATPGFGVAGVVTHAHLISMWTAPIHRKRGVGRLLVSEVLKWARGRNARSCCCRSWATTKTRFVSTSDLGLLEPGELSLIRMIHLSWNTRCRSQFHDRVVSLSLTTVQFTGELLPRSSRILG